MPLTWTQVTAPSPPTGFNFISVVWAAGLNLWWACGTGPGAGTTTNLLYKSSDGITWTNVDPGFQKSYNVVEWSPDLGQLCFLSALSFTGGTSTHVITTSTDGVNFTEHDIPDGPGPTLANNSQFRGLCWAGGTIQKWVAVASVAAYAHQVITSPDGAIWTNQVAAAARQWGSVAYSPTLGLAATSSTSSSSSNVMTSTDGVNWTSRTTPTNVRFNINNNLSWGNGLFLTFAAVNNGGVTADQAHPFTSSDGITWTEGTDAGMLANHGWQNAVWAPHANQWVAVANGASPSPGFGRSATSPDGIAWTIIDDRTGVIAFLWKHVAISSTRSQLVAVASTNAAIMYAQEPTSTPPTIDSLSVSTGPTVGGTPVTITGTNFTVGATVTLCGVPATSIVVVSPTSITLVTPGHTSGVCTLTVTNPDTTNASASFTYGPSGLVVNSNWKVQRLDMEIRGEEQS